MSESNVTKFYPKGAAENPDNVLEQAMGQYSDVLIIGYDKDGYLDVRASTTLDHTQINWLVDSFKNKLLNGDYGVEE